MVEKASLDTRRARAASREEIPALIYHASEEVLANLLENPRLDEEHLCLLLERKELSGTLLEAIVRRREWLRSYAIRRRLAFHPHAPRLLAMRLARELYLMDLVQFSLLPSVTAELRRMAEELILARLPQLPRGQKLALARRGSARVAGGLLAEGHARVVPLALDNAFLTEAQVLKVLSREKLPAAVVAAIAHHPKWSQLYAVRMAVMRHAQAPLARVLTFLPDLNLRDLSDLGDSVDLAENLRKYIRHEIAKRSQPEGRGGRRGSSSVTGRQ